MWNTPSRRWEKPLDDRMAMSGLGGWDSGGLASGCVVTSLYKHTKHNIHNQEGERKKNKQTWTWVGSNSKKGEVCDTFV